MDYKMILNCISEKYQKILNENLVGIYIHGSIALGCFNWNKSDIDFLVVVNKELSQDIKIKLIDVVVGLNKNAPYKGLEMSIVLKENCTNFIYPTPFELHFSNMHMKWYLEDSNDYCKKMNGLDEDLAAHFTIINKCGIVLYGLPIEDVFGKVPIENYIDSIKGDVENAKTDIYDSPMYIVLNLCRAAAYIHDNLILSKAQGGLWGISNLESSYNGIIIQALHSYETNEIMSIQNEEADNFCDYMLKKINQSEYNYAEKV